MEETMKNMVLSLAVLAMLAVPTALGSPSSVDGYSATKDKAGTKRCCYTNPQGRTVCCYIADYIPCQPGICM